jgi:hypothetical protein
LSQPRIVPENAASMLNLGPEEAPNLGGSTRAKSEAMFLLLNIPAHFRVGERPAGTVNGVG